MDQPNRRAAVAPARRPIMRSFTRSAPLGRAALRAAIVLGALSVATSPSRAADPIENRYPYDPACAWGRIANGKGMLVRCITQQEAQALLAGGGATPAAGKTEQPPAGEPPPEAQQPEQAPPPPESAKEVRIELLEVKADVGTLSLAMQKLGAPKDRYLKCVAEHGGLRGERGEVHVRFLVRSRGRAEGVSVAKRAGVSREAAACMADVVDRRLVGTPEAPYVGATAVFRLSRQ